MSIKDFILKIKPFFTDIKARASGFKNKLEIKSDLFIVLLIIAVGFASFGLGRLSALEKQKTPISVINNENSLSMASVNESASAASASSTGQKGTVFSSKSGTKYYYPWCSGANRVKDDDRVWFATIDAAKVAGLTPAANCPGLN